MSEPKPYRGRLAAKLQPGSHPAGDDSCMTLRDEQGADVAYMAERFNDCEGANARRLALAWNAHDNLLDACKLLLLADENGIGHAIDILPAVIAAKDAVRKAEGGAL